MPKPYVNFKNHTVQFNRNTDINLLYYCPLQKQLKDFLQLLKYYRG